MIARRRVSLAKCSREQYSKVHYRTVQYSTAQHAVVQSVAVVCDVISMMMVRSRSTHSRQALAHLNCVLYVIVTSLIQNSTMQYIQYIYTYIQ